MKKEKTGGRTKGTPNRTTAVIRDNFQMLVESNLEQLQRDIKQMSAKDRVNTILQMAKFNIPTLKAAELKTTADSNFTPIIINLDKENANTN